MAELDLFKLICKTLISLFFSRGSVIVDKRAAVGTAMDNYSEMMFVSDADAAGPPRIETAVSLWS